MSKQKKDNAMQLDPDRFKVAQSMSTVPGGPMNNYPVAQGDFIQKSSLSGVNTFPYGDSGLSGDERMGGVFPNLPSQMPQQATMGRGYQSQVPYGQQQQPPASAGDELMGNYAGIDAQNRGLNPSMMGPIGMEAQPAPGGVVPSPQQTQSTMGLTGMPNAEMAASGMNMKTGKRGKK